MQSLENFENRCNYSSVPPEYSELDSAKPFNGIVITYSVCCCKQNCEIANSIEEI